MAASTTAPSCLLDRQVPGPRWCGSKAVCDTVLGEQDKGENRTRTARGKFCPRGLLVTSGGPSGCCCVAAVGLVLTFSGTGPGMLLTVLQRVGQPRRGEQSCPDVRGVTVGKA